MVDHNLFSKQCFFAKNFKKMWYFANFANVCTYFSETEGKTLKKKKKCIFQNDHVSALLSKVAGLNFLPFLCWKAIHSTYHCYYNGRMSMSHCMPSLKISKHKVDPGLIKQKYYF